MFTRNTTKRASRSVLLFGSIRALAMAALLGSCSENVGPHANKSNDFEAFLRDGPGSSGVSFDNIDESVITGIAQTDVRFLHDDRLGDVGSVCYNAMAGNSDGPIAFSSATADGATLAANFAGIVYNGYNSQATGPAAGGRSTWDLTTEDGVSLAGAAIDIPARPDITAPRCYERPSISHGFNITTNSSVEGGDAVVIIAYDSYRDGLYGLAGDAHIEGSAVTLRSITLDDDGTLEIPASLLAGLASNRVYNVLVYRWRYATFARNDGSRVGIVADTQYGIPLILIP